MKNKGLTLLELIITISDCDHSNTLYKVDGSQLQGMRHWLICHHNHRLRYRLSACRVR
ncbi:hypothetical protein [Photobacterium leiognathi]|uniref:hypothetical protein n=1 Tax=Photobacterium leiognathi TaxID=553611 RepID=UPI0029827420|nr:hypothetical protein [Photobacterium leiognathi]